jgi:hypothetical protein
MPVAKLFTKSQWDAFARTLDALPEKPDAERGVGVRDAMKEMRGHIRGAQTKGYTLEQIAQHARQAGIEITAGTIRYALRPVGKGNSAGGAARPVAKALAPGTVTTLSRTHGAAQGGALRANGLRDDGNTDGRREARPHGGKSEVKPQPMPVQGSLAFAIKPDTDDL